eukprot:gene163-100_t
MFASDAFDPESVDEEGDGDGAAAPVELFGVGDGYDADGVWDFTNVEYMQDPDVMELEQLVVLIKTQKQQFGLQSIEEIEDEEKLSVEPAAFERQIEEFRLTVGAAYPEGSHPGFARERLRGLSQLWSAELLRYLQLVLFERAKRMQSEASSRRFDERLMALQADREEIERHLELVREEQAATLLDLEGKYKTVLDVQPIKANYLIINADEANADWRYRLEHAGIALKDMCDMPDFKDDYLEDMTDKDFLVTIRDTELRKDVVVNIAVVCSSLSTSLFNKNGVEPVKKHVIEQVPDAGL